MHAGNMTLAIATTTPYSDGPVRPIEKPLTTSCAATCKMFALSGSLRGACRRSVAIPGPKSFIEQSGKEESHHMTNTNNRELPPSASSARILTLLWPFLPILLPLAIYLHRRTRGRLRPIRVTTSHRDGSITQSCLACSLSSASHYSCFSLF